MCTPGTWELVRDTDLPSGHRPASSKWVYKIKENKDGTIDKFKARFTVRGFTQRQGIDYERAFSATLRSSSFRTLCALAAQNGLQMWHVDAVSAFTQADMDVDLFVQPARGYEQIDPATGRPLLLKLKRALYGTKQASRLWQESGNLPEAKQLGCSAALPNKPRRRKAMKTTTKTATHKEDHEEVTAAHSTDEYVGTSIEVYWSKGGGGSWQEGEIIAQDGKDKVQVRYSDSTEEWHNLAKIKYKFCLSQTHANQSIIWECTGCGCLNKTGSAPTARSSCTKCKREFGLLGVLLGGKRRRTEITPMERKIQSKRTRQEGPAHDLCSPALVQMHGTTDQRGEIPTDTETMFAASNGCRPRQRWNLWHVWGRF